MKRKPQEVGEATEVERRRKAVGSEQKPPPERSNEGQCDSAESREVSKPLELTSHHKLPWMLSTQLPVLKSAMLDFNGSGHIMGCWGH